MHRQSATGTPLSLHIVQRPARGGLRFLALSLAVGACSSSEEKGPSRQSADAYIDALAGAITVSGAGELVDLPEQDPSLSVSGSGSGGVVSVEARAVVTASISFEAPNGNVVAAGISFSSGGQILTVPMPDMAGQTSGTLSFQLQFPADFCANLGSICHSIQCYEYAITSDGKVSAANIVDMAAACGECTDSSCVGLLPECTQEIPTTCNAADGSALGPGETLYEVEGQVSALALGGAALYVLADDLLKLPLEPGGTPEVLVSDVSRGEELVRVGDQLFFSDSDDQVFQLDEAGGEPRELGELGEQLVGDGQFVYAAFNTFLCDPEDADQQGIRRIDASGAVTVLDASAACVASLTVGDGYVYWLSAATSDEELFRIPVNGGSPEKMPLDVVGWSHIEWTDGYLVGRDLIGNDRGRPEQTMHEGLSISFDGTGSDGQSVLFTSLGSESCVAQVQGGGERVDIASFDPAHMSIADLVGNAEYVYSAVVLTEQQLIVPPDPVTRIVRIQRP